MKPVDSAVRKTDRQLLLDAGVKIPRNGAGSDQMPDRLVTVAMAFEYFRDDLLHFVCRMILMQLQDLDKVPSPLSVPLTFPQDVEPYRDFYVGA